MKKLITIFAGFVFASNLNALTLTPEQVVIRTAIGNEILKLQGAVAEGDLESAFILDDLNNRCDEIERKLARENLDGFPVKSSDFSISETKTPKVLTRNEITTCRVLRAMQACASQKNN